jgi:sugar lactone lactonase YvrE
MGKQFLSRHIAGSWTVGWCLRGLLGLLLLLSHCGSGEESGSLSPPAQRNPQLEQRAVENLLSLYQTAWREEDIDRLQELLHPGNPSVQANAWPQATAGPEQSATEFRQAMTTVFRTRDLIDLQILEPDIRLEADSGSVSFLQVETSVAGDGATLEQQTLAVRTTLHLIRREENGKVIFSIAGVVQEAPQFQVVTPGRVLAGVSARVTVLETTGTVPLATVEVGVPETGTVQPLREVAGVFHGLFTPPAQRDPQPLRVRIRGAHGEAVEFPHRYRLRGPGEEVMQRLDGTGAARFSAVALAPDGTVWVGGVDMEPPGRGGVLYSVPPGKATASFVASLVTNPTGRVEDLVFDRLGRLHAVVFAQGPVSHPVNVVVVLDQNVFCHTVNAFDPRQHYPFQVRDRTTGVIVPSPSTRAVAAAAGNIWLHGSDGGVAQVADTFRQGQCPETGAEVHYDSVFKRAPGALLTNSVPALVVGADGGLWFGTALGLTRLHNGQFMPVPFDPNLSLQGDPQTLEEFFPALAAAIFGARPIVTVAIGEVSFVDEFGVPLRKADLIFSAVEDHRQRLWVGTLGEGVRRIEVREGVPRDTLHLTRQDGLSSNIILALAVGPDGSIWAATEEGVSQIQDVDDAVVITNFTALDGLALPVRDVAVDKGGTVWLATDGGLFRLLPQGGLVRGVVRDTAGRPVVGADISVFGTPFRTVTDAAGRFVLTQLPLGTHLLQFDGSLAVSGPLTSAFREVTITAGEQTLSTAVELVPQVTDEFRIVVLSGNSQVGIVGQPLDAPLVVKVRDGTGVAIPEIPITFTVLAGGGAVTVTTARTNAAGQAATSLILGTKAGDNLVLARTQGLSPVVFTATGQADRGSARLIEVDGNNQACEPGQVLPNPLVVRLADQFGNPLEETVTATVRVGAATFVSTGLSTADLRTNAQGEAAFTVRLGHVADCDVLVEMTALAAEPVQFLSTSSFISAAIGNGIAVEADGSLLVLDALRDQLLRLDPVGDAPTVVSSATVGTGPLFSTPAELAREGRHSSIVGNGFPPAVIRVDLASGNRTFVSGCANFDLDDSACTVPPVGTGPSLGFPVALAIEASGTIVVGDAPLAAPSFPAVIRVDPVTGDRTLVSGCSVFDFASSTCTVEVGTGPPLGSPEALAIEASGAIIVGDTEAKALLRVNPASGNRTVVSGCANALCSATVGTGPPLDYPQALAVEAHGTLVVADRGVRTKTRALLRVDPVSGNRTVISGCANAACSPLVGTGPAFSLIFPDAIAITADGALVVFDAGIVSGAVLRVDPVSGARRILSLLLR